MPKEMDIKDFVVAQKDKVGEGSNHRHKVSRGYFPGDDRVWIRKEIVSPDKARIELLAQEFFRLIIAYEPETRIALNQKNGVYYILSQEIPGFQRFPKDESSKFHQGQYTGLASAVLLALFIEEIDLKRDNIGIDLQNRVVKIDGDWSFGSITYEYGRYPITAEIIKKLPTPTSFYAYNWLNFINENQRKSSNLLGDDFNLSSAFSAEMNKTLLQLCLIPDVFYQSFVDGYLSSGGQRFVDFFNRRSALLKKCVYQIPSFVTYLNSQEAQNDAQCFYERMVSFCPSGGEKLFSEEQSLKLKIEFGLLRDALLSQKDLKPAKDLTFKVPEKITYIVGSEGLELNEYLQKNKEKHPFKGRFFKEDELSRLDVKQRMFAIEGREEGQPISDVWALGSNDWKHRIVYKKIKDSALIICPSPK